jgi:hypothetical protein
MIIPHYLRCKQSDFATLVSLAKLLGIIAEHTDESGQSHIHGINGNDWDYRGTLYEPTGETVPGDYGPIALMRPIADETGTPYVHVNVNLRFNLAERAATMAAEYPELAAALADTGRFFLLDENGKPRAPKNPQVRFAA